MSSQELEFAAAVVRSIPDALSSGVMQTWIENPVRLRQALEKTLKWSGLLELLMAQPAFRLWATVKLGVGAKSGPGLIGMLRGRHIDVSDVVVAALGHPSFTVMPLATEVDLIKPTVGDLSFRYGAHLGEISDRAQTFLFHLCPLEVVPQIVLQLEGPNFFIGWTEAVNVIVRNGDGALEVYTIGFDDRGVLGVREPNDSPPLARIWKPDCRFVFILPRKPKPVAAT